MPNPGDRVCGHVRLLRWAPPGMSSPIFGPAMVAQDEESGADLWVAIIKHDFLPTSVDFSEFMASVNTLMRMRHPGLVRIELVDREERFAIVGYEALVGAKSLDELRGKSVAVPTVLQIANRVARALGYLHGRRGVHGALSLSSIVQWEGAPMLWGYGLATQTRRQAIADAAKRASSQQVFAPEVLRTEPLSPATDVYGWGVVVAQLATGLEATEAVATVLDAFEESDVPTALLDIVRDSLANDPAKRPRSMDAVLRRLVEVGLVEEGSGLVRLGPDTDSPDPVGARPTEPLASASASMEMEAVHDPRRGLAAPGSAASEYSAADFADLNEVRPEPEPDPSASSSFTELSGSDFVMEEDDVEAGRAAREESGPQRGARTQDPKPYESVNPTAKLQALATEHVGEEIASKIERVLSEEEGGGAADSMSEAALIDLAQSQGEEFAPSLDVPGAIDVAGVGEPSGVSELPEEPVGATPPPALEIERPRERAPGPHGPEARIPSLAIAAIAAALALGAAAHVSADKGIDALIAMPEPDSPAAKAPDANAAGTGTTDAAETEGEESGGEEAATPTDLPPAGPKECAAGLVPVDDAYCVMEAEYPGLRRAPLDNVGFREAQAACEELNLRLCTSAEWQKACKGPEGLRFGYGGRPEGDRCNTRSVAGYEGEVSVAGSHARCTNAYGVYDMVGNVGEWVAEGSAMGGDSTTPMQDAACDAKGRPPPGFRGRGLGFRCCSDR